MLLACAHAGPPTARTGARPERFTAETLEGERFEIGGPGPVRLVELWATWCEPCGPATGRAREVLARHPGVVAYALALDDDRAAVERHVAAFPPLGGRALLYVGGAGAAARAGLPEIPTFLALDARGRVVGSVTGLTPGLGPALHRLLRRAEGRLGEPD